MVHTMQLTLAVHCPPCHRSCWPQTATAGPSYQDSPEHWDPTTVLTWLLTLKLPTPELMTVANIFQQQVTPSPLQGGGGGGGTPRTKVGRAGLSLRNVPRPGGNPVLDPGHFGVPKWRSSGPSRGRNPPKRPPSPVWLVCLVSRSCTLTTVDIRFRLEEKWNLCSTVAIWRPSDDTTILSFLVFHLVACRAATSTGSPTTSSPPSPLPSSDPAVAPSAPSAPSASSDIFTSA